MKNENTKCTVHIEMIRPYLITERRAAEINGPIFNSIQLYFCIHIFTLYLCQPKQRNIFFIYKKTSDVFPMLCLFPTLLLNIQEMQKSQLSTSMEASSVSNSKSSESHLMQLVRNLELELGYHAIALKKAEKMIKILQNDNNLLRNQNSILKIKCKQLQQKIVKFQHSISSISQASENAEYLKCFSARPKKQKYHQVPNMRVLQQNASYGNRSVNKRLSKVVEEQETANGRGERNLVESNRLTYETKKGKDSDCRSPIVRIARRQNISPGKGSSQSMSFIPFDQLKIRTEWR